MRAISAAMLLRSLSLVTSAALASCARDVVLPDATTAPVCGDGVVQEGETCDVASPGCVACAVVPTFRCSTAGCSPVCGDGVIGDTTTGTDDVLGTPSCASPRRASACAMTGYWAAREVDYTRDAVLGGLQTSSNWFLYRFEQTGDAFEVKEELDCGVHVTGSATVDYTPGTLRALIYEDRMDGGDGRPARRGIAKATPAGCEISLERWYKVRGAAESYLPADFAAHPSLASLPPLPSVADPVAGDEVPPGATDPDGDGIPGVAFQITGIVTGIRNSAQRDWKEFAGAGVPPGALELDVPGGFDLQENVLRVTDCGTGCALLASVANVAEDVRPHVTFAYIGEALGGPRVRDVVVAAPRTDLESDLTTCARVRKMLPHDGGVR